MVVVSPVHHTPPHTGRNTAITGIYRTHSIMPQLRVILHILRGMLYKPRMHKDISKHIKLYIKAK